MEVILWPIAYSLILVFAYMLILAQWLLVFSALFRNQYKDKKWFFIDLIPFVLFFRVLFGKLKELK